MESINHTLKTLAAASLLLTAAAATATAKPGLTIKQVLLSSDAETVSKKNFKFYRSSDGISVEVAFLESDPPRALVRVNGVRNPVAGHTLLHTIEDGRRTVFTTLIEGRPQATLVKSMSRWSRYPVIYLYLRGRRGGIRLFYDEKATKEADANALLNAHRAGVKDGSLKKLQGFDRAVAQAKVEADLAQQVEAVTKKTGAKISIQVDWTGVSDDQVKRLCMSSYFGRPIDGLRRLAGKDAFKDVIGKRIKQIRIRFGGRMKLELRDGVVDWTASEAGGNQDDFAYYNLMNLLS